MNLLTWSALGLAVVCGVAAAFFLLRGLGTRQRVGSELYAVGRQAQRREMRVNLVRSAAFLVLALIALVVFSLGRRPMPEAPAVDSAATPSPTGASTATPLSATPSPRVVPSPVINTTSPAAPSASPTTPPDIPTLTPTATATATETPRPPTALVNSPNGLYLREAPGGSQELELIADGAELVLLEGRERANELEWQRVRTPAGNEGWVALDFIVIQDAP